MTVGRHTASGRNAGLPFWLGAAAGWALIAWGVRGVLEQRLHTRPGQLLRFFATGLAAHDLLLAPAVLATGAVIARAVPSRWRSVTQAALIVAGTTALYAFPLVRGYGRALGNPTSLPHDYAGGLVAVVAVVAAVAVTVAIGTLLFDRRTLRRET